MLKPKPMNDWVHVKPDPKITHTKNGIALPDQHYRPTVGTVLAVGPGKRDPRTGKRIPVDLVAGQRIIWMAAAAEWMEIDGEELVFVPASQVHLSYEESK